MLVLRVSSRHRRETIKQAALVGGVDRFRVRSEATCGT